MEEVYGPVLVAAVAVIAVVVAIAVATRARRAERETRAQLARARSDDERRENDVAATGQRLVHALDLLEHGVIVCDEHGAIVLRNARAAAVVDDPAGGALVASTIHRLVDQALDGPDTVESLELFGPPRRTIQVSVRAVASGDRLMGVVALIEDVTERRRLEAVRRDFVANISHELKTPVGALGLLAETLVDEDDPAVGRRLATRMQDEAIRVGRIIEDLLDLSRIESEEATRREPVPIHLVVAEATDRLRPAAEHRGVSLDVADVPRSHVVLGDRRQLVSALHSLVENAISYTDEGGTVVVGAERSDARVVVSVSDTGLGIPARDLDRIFERFYRVDRARARATGGTGLGLSIVRHVAQNHGGEVRVRSQEGVGSTFSLELPVAPAWPRAEAS